MTSLSFLSLITYKKKPYSAASQSAGYKLSFYSVGIGELA
jgi:hypothetical protein